MDHWGQWHLGLRYCDRGPFRLPGLPDPSLAPVPCLYLSASHDVRVGQRGLEIALTHSDLRVISLLYLLVI